MISKYKKLIIGIVFLANANSSPAQTSRPLIFAQQIIQLPSGSAPGDVSIADLNHDGKPDLAIPEHDLDTLAIFTQTAAGTFPTRSAARYHIPNGPQTAVPIALTGYGPAGSPPPTPDDLVVGVPLYNLLYFFDNTGTAPGVLSLTARPAVGWVPSGTAPANSWLQTAPLNKDLYPDLAFLVGVNQHYPAWTRRHGGLSQQCRHQSIDPADNVSAEFPAGRFIPCRDAGTRHFRWLDGRARYQRSGHRHGRQQFWLQRPVVAARISGYRSLLRHSPRSQRRWRCER